MKDKLSDSDKYLAELLLAGLSFDTVALILRKKDSTIKTNFKRLCKLCGVKTRKGLTTKLKAMRKSGLIYA